MVSLFSLVSLLTMYFEEGYRISGDSSDSSSVSLPPPDNVLPLGQKTTFRYIFLTSRNLKRSRFSNSKWIPDRGSVTKVARPVLTLTFIASLAILYVLYSILTSGVS